MNELNSKYYHISLFLIYILGAYEIEFDANKYNLSSGIYFYQLRAGEYNSIKKFTLIK